MRKILLALSILLIMATVAAADTIYLRDGRTIRGRRLNEDSFTIQVIDEQSRLVSLVKSDLRTFEFIPTSSMPSYAATLTADERADLVAYLLSLKGR